MVELPPLGRHRVLVALPEAPASELVSICEVLCQEGYTAWSMPPERLDTAVELMQIFGRRARFGVHDVPDAPTLRQAVKAGAVFASTRVLRPNLVKVVPDFPVILGGATPTELLSGLKAGAAAVQLWPADGYGERSAADLITVLSGAPVIAAGQIDPESAAGWFRAGAVGVWPVGLLGSDFDLAGLRELLHWWRPEA